MNLLNGLTSHPRHLLRRIAQYYDIRFDNAIPRRQVAARIATFLTAHLTEILATLPTDARAALQSLAVAQSRLPAWEFLSRFGPLRPYKPWRHDLPAPTAAALPSPAAMLFYRGLVFRTRKPDSFVLPAELAFHFPPSPPKPKSAPPLPSPAPVPDIRLRTVILLETRDRELLARLFEQRAIRNRLGETIAPRYAVLTPVTKPRDLIRRLERLGYVVAIDPTSPPALALPTSSATVLAPQDIQRLLVAVHLSAILFDPPPLTFKDLVPSSELIAALQATLSPDAREQAHRTAQDLLDRRLYLPPDEIPDEPKSIRFPTAQTREVLQTAIDSQVSVVIEYFTYGRNDLTRRVVEPRRIEYRQEIPYLIAYCHWRRTERCFRVDRIKRAESIQ